MNPPEGNAIAAPAIADNAASDETWNLVTSSTSTATRGRALYPIAVPVALTALALLVLAVRRPHRHHTAEV